MEMHISGRYKWGASARGRQKWMLEQRIPFNPSGRQRCKKICGVRSTDLQEGGSCMQAAEQGQQWNLPEDCWADAVAGRKMLGPVRECGSKIEM